MIVDLWNPKFFNLELGLMKYKNSNYIILRDASRAFFALFFYTFIFLEDIIGREIEFETEFVVLGSILLFGTFWCGWACPFGNASYFMNKLGKKLFPKLQYNPPHKVDWILRNLKYILLLFFTWVLISNEISYFDDHMNMYSANSVAKAFHTLKVIPAVLIIPIFIPRFFCKYLCFQKAGYNIINYLFRFTTINRDNEICTDCGRCDKVCSMNIKISEKDNIYGNDCIGCYDCIAMKTCPKKSQALSLVFIGKKVNYLRFLMIALGLYIIATYLVIFVFNVAEV